EWGSGRGGGSARGPSVAVCLVSAGVARLAAALSCCIGTMLAGMRAVALTIDAEEPTHSTTGHPKHSRALPASPAEWRIVASPARAPPSPRPLALLIASLSPRRVRPPGA